jgi:hypothetical protein
MQPIRSLPVRAYAAGKIQGVPMTGGQGQAIVSAGGKASVTVGPQGLGTIWYPAQATISTTTGPLDTSTCSIYLGPNGVPNVLVAQVYTGNGVAALAIPSMSPGQYIIAVWTGGHTGDIAAINVIGTMDALHAG